MSKRKSKMWNTYHIPEKWLKWYENMDENKIRPVLVISDSSLLVGKCLVVELSTHDDFNPYRIEYCKFLKKKQMKL